MNDWTKTPEGNLLAYPLIGWDTQIAPMNGLLRLRYATSEAEYEAEGIGLQLYATPAVLRGLSQVLLQMAERVEAQSLETRQ